MERGAEALEGVGVPELTEGAGPEARPGDKDPQAAWGLDAADREKKQVPRVLRPPYPLKLGPECWGGWSGGGGQNPPGPWGCVQATLQGGPPGRRLFPAREAVATPQNPLGSFAGPLYSPQSSRRLAATTARPPPLRWGGGMGPRQWVGREFLLSGDSRARGPQAPPAGRAPLRTVLASRRSGRPQATRCSLGRKLGATPRDQRVKKEGRAGGVEARAAG